MAWRGLAVILFVTTLASPGVAADFRLLRLGGQVVKWGEPVLGAGAALTWSFAQRRHDFPDAINCRVVTPLTGLFQAAGIEPSEAEALFTRSFRQWETAANLSFRYVENEDAADILIGAQGEPTGIAFANVWHEPRSGAAIAPLTRASICLNPMLRWEKAPDGNSDTYEISHVAAHEIGHAIGLDHPGPAGALMGYQYNEGDGELRSGDVAGAVTLYGVRAAD